MKYTVRFSTTFKKAFKKCMRRGYDENIFQQALYILMEEGRLPSKYKPHILQGDWNGFWECHLTTDWLFNLGTERRRANVIFHGYRNTQRFI